MSEEANEGINGKDKLNICKDFVENGVREGCSPGSIENIEIFDESVKSPLSLNPKVPPLKIVITSHVESEQGKSNKVARHGLPYVVIKDNQEKSNGMEEDTTATTATVLPTMEASVVPVSNSSSFPATSDEQPTRTLRSNNMNKESNSGHTSPIPEISSTVTPQSCEIGDDTSKLDASKGCKIDVNKAKDAKNNKESALQGKPEAKEENKQECTLQQLQQRGKDAIVDIQHPRKRKMKKDMNLDSGLAQSGHPNAYSNDKMTKDYEFKRYLDIRRVLDKKKMTLVAVKPKPPEGYNDYVMFRREYLLKRNANKVKFRHPPDTLDKDMLKMYEKQENERVSLKKEHIIQKEKLALNVEEEILRVHGRAAMALAGQDVPLSTSSILMDKEWYNPNLVENNEKCASTTERARYTGRIFFGWLQDLDDKWEKVKMELVNRQNNEADALESKQRIDWVWEMREVGLLAPRQNAVIEENHVYRVVSVPIEIMKANPKNERFVPFDTEAFVFCENEE